MMLGPIDIAKELESIVKAVDEIASRLNATTTFRADLENFVISSTEPGSAFRSAVIQAGTNISLCQGKVRVLTEALEHAAEMYREAGKL